MKRTVLLLLTAMLLSLTLTACGNDKEQNAETTQVPQPSATVEVSKEPATAAEEEQSADLAPTAEPEHGTTAYLEYLMAKAKAAASTATKEDLQEAVDWLRDNPQGYFNGLDNMEKTLYYGRLLECKYMQTGNQFEKIGWQAQKTVKYVYRGAESITDEVTHNNLLKLQEMAAELPDIN